MLKLPQFLTSVPLSTFGPVYSPHERLLQGIAKGLAPSEMREELGHVERISDDLLNEGLIVRSARHPDKFVEGHWCNFYEITQNGLGYMVKAWARENLLF